ncbi:MAG: AbrB/MazE/SpoVT family DNA-binding domain-containing protein [Phascolarctobacterium sp.]|nr:AbrB/MazE/SpoVT family DNA-binding domain-containing protein [Candidatus Phascolarctobacterium caballi]
MESSVYIDTAKVMAKGQVTIPKEVREILSLVPGSKIGFVKDGNGIRIVNPAMYAMKTFQEQMKEYANSMTDAEIMAMVKEARQNL